MTDLSRILPAFPTAAFTSLLPAIEHHGLTTTDLLALHPADIAKQTRLPLIDLKRLVAAITASLTSDVVPETLSPNESVPSPPSDAQSPSESAGALSGASAARLQTISCLDEDVDQALGGGVPVGCITEFAGESGAAKTQILMSLCLAVQLPPPHGLSRPALYLSTESGLATQRLAQLLSLNPVLQKSGLAHQDALDNIQSAVMADLETQDHILEYQVPVLLSRHNIGLIILDSVAANYRAEFEREGSRGSNMAARSSQLIRLGALLRDLARKHNLAVVVANQVADRFPSAPAERTATAQSQDSPLASRSMPPPPLPPMSSSTPPSTAFAFGDEEPPSPPVLLLDHQQRWFTGWGDDPQSSRSLKTPSLGLVWTTQLGCRVALLKRPVYGRTRLAAPMQEGDAADDYEVDVRAPTLRTWRRWLKVVFAPHVASSEQGIHGAVEFEVTAGGIKAVKKKIDHAKH